MADNVKFKCDNAFKGETKMTKRYVVKLMKANRITIPKEVVRKLHLEEYAVLTVEDNKIVIRPAKVVVYDEENQTT